MAESSSYKDYVAGLLAGVATVAIGHPFDTVKKGNSQNSKPDLHVIVPSAAYGGGVISFVPCPSELVKVQGIFRGGYTTFLRESFGNAVWFSVYEYVKYYMHLQFKSSSSKYNNLIDVGTGILSGGLGGVAFWCTVLPLDVAKTIIQTASDSSSARNPFGILNSIYRRTGFGGRFRSYNS